MEALTMAKKSARKGKTGPKAAPPEDQRDDLIALRCRSVYKEWVQAVAEAERVTPTQLIDKALAHFAKSFGHQLPPRR